ncbi:MAG: chitobiase/beta-hexosaminidase C-terminal domain-containing protein, partial [Limisphaerales bacterium]
MKRVFLLFALCQSVSAAVVHDVAQEFSTTSNPNGVWSYGYTTADNSVQFGLCPTNMNGSWVNACLYSPVRGLECSPVIQYIIDGGLPTVRLSKNFNFGEVPVVRFTSPSNANYTIDIQVAGGYGADPEQFRIRINGQNVLVTNFPISVSYSSTLALAAGAVVDFIGSPNNTILNRANTVRLRGSVTLTTEADRPPEISFVPQGREFTNQIGVALVNNLTNGVIRFTLDGSLPSASSAIYTNPLTFISFTEAHATVFSNSSPISQVYTSTYTRVYAIDDGIPASWREQYFGSGYRTDPRVSAEADPDGDGTTNREEYLAGTNPMDKTSGFKATIRAIPLISFPSETNRIYRVLRKQTSDSAATAIATLTATNSPTIFIDTTA